MVDPQEHLVFFVAAGVAAIAAGYDLRTGRIPDRLTIPVLLLAPLFHIARISIVAHKATDLALSEGLASVGGAALCTVVPALLYRQGAIGGGDVKILAALGALLQPMIGLEAEMYGMLAGAILAPAKLAYEGKLLSTLKNAFAIGSNLFLPKAKQKTIDSTALSWFRLGPALFVGVVLTAYLHW